MPERNPPTFLKDPPRMLAAPVGWRTAAASYTYLTVLAVVRWNHDVPLGYFLIALVPPMLWSISAGRAAARRRGVTRRPFSNAQALAFTLPLTIGAFVSAPLIDGDWPNVRWYGVWLLLVIAAFDLADRHLWRRATAARRPNQ